MALSTVLLMAASDARRSAKDRVGVLVALAATLCCVSFAVHAQAPIRLIDFVEANDGERNVDVQVQFNCTVRYMAHDPLDYGQRVRIRLRLGNDCGVNGRSIAGELPTIGGDSRIVKAARLEEAAPAEAAVILEWARPYNYVLAPTTNGRGIRVRVLNAFKGQARMLVIESEEESPSGYAINLMSSTTPFEPAEIDAAQSLLKTTVYVSTVELEATKWYRLRAGPIVRRPDADRLLVVAQQPYPRAWLGIDDEPNAVGEPIDKVSTVAPTVPIDPALPDDERAKLLDAARRAMSRKDYAKSTELLTKLTRQPEYPARSQAQELLGLTRERAGQVAHAKAEYQEYLRRYPDGDAAGRIRKRLRALATAALAAKTGTGGGRDDGAWKLTGGAAQTYRWENNSITAPEVNTSQQTQNAVYTDGDFIARRRGEQYDFVARVSAGYAKDMLTNGPGDQARVSAAFVELTDRERGIAARFGRQSRNSGGLLGTFDGLFGSYQLRPKMAVNVAVGLPVESTRSSPQTDRQFIGISTDFGPFREHWDFSTYLIAQQYAGETDRRAVGFETRYFVPGRTLVTLIDYDFFYQQLNSVVLMGSLQLPARWALSFNLDHRQSPVLTTRNALIGQPVATLDELLGLFSSEEIRRLAEDRTPLSDAYSLSLSRPLGERFEMSLDVFASRTAASVASGGVEATPATGLDRTIQLQLSGSSLWKSSDWWVLQLRTQDSSNRKIDSVGLASRLPIGGAWRLGPRIRVDRRVSQLDSAREILYVPTLRLDYQKGRTWIEFEGGAELGSRDLLPVETEKTRRYYFGLGYRLSF